MMGRAVSSGVAEAATAPSAVSPGRARPGPGLRTLAQPAALGEPTRSPALRTPALPLCSLSSSAELGSLGFSFTESNKYRSPCGSSSCLCRQLSGRWRPRSRGLCPGLRSWQWDVTLAPSCAPDRLPQGTFITHAERFFRRCRQNTAGREQFSTLGHGPASLGWGQQVSLSGRGLHLQKQPLHPRNARKVSTRVLASKAPPRPAPAPLPRGWLHPRVGAPARPGHLGASVG